MQGRWDHLSKWSQVAPKFESCPPPPPTLRLPPRPATAMATATTRAVGGVGTALGGRTAFARGLVLDVGLGLEGLEELVPREWMEC